MRRHDQRKHALALIYMHIMRKQSFDDLVQTLKDTARLERLLVLVEEKGEALPGVNLRLIAKKHDGAFKAKSNKDGVSTFKNVLKGEYTLSIERELRDYVFTSPHLGLTDASMVAVEPEVNEKKRRLRFSVNQLTFEPIVLDIEQLRDDLTEIQVRVETFLPYMELNDVFMNVLYRIEERSEIYEAVINDALTTAWRFDRLGTIEQAILLLACAELEYGDVPKTIVVNEAVELAKMFSDEASYKLINGVLDSL